MIRLSRGVVLADSEPIQAQLQDGTLITLTFFEELLPYDQWNVDRGSLIQIEQPIIDIEGLEVGIPEDLRILGCVKFGVGSILSFPSSGNIALFSRVQPFFQRAW